VQDYWSQHPYAPVDPQIVVKNILFRHVPYPSGSGLHVGHWRGYVLSEVYARMKVLQGYHAASDGWDAFGLPEKTLAIKEKIHPKNLYCAKHCRV